jgi:hypothetical protein
MNKLEEIHLNLIERNTWNQTEYKELHTFENKKSFAEISGEIIAQKSAEITTDVAIKFAEFITNKNWKEYIDIDTGDGTKIYWYQYKNSTKYYTTQELFEEFINNHYGK